MERMTERDAIGAFVLSGVEETGYGPARGAVIDRLAEYEDTGKTPEEVRESVLKTDVKKWCEAGIMTAEHTEAGRGWRNALRFILECLGEAAAYEPPTLDGLAAKELAEYKALEANGLLIRVPRSVYETDGIRVYEHGVHKVIFDTDGPAFDVSAIGKSIFLTREEAETRVIMGKEGKN